ncbi:MAG: ABC transporter substrate-binding protein [Lachnospiraceae bacterium]|nr:ABC transporter substrate-binding protein [Lachnospiraceae bacterium]
MKNEVRQDNVSHDTIRRQWARPVAAALVAALSLSAFAGCAKKAEPLQELTVTLGENVVVQPLVGIAREKGYFKEYGLEINAVTSTSSVMEMLETGKIDVTLNGIIPALSYGAQGSKIKIIGGTASGGNVVIAKPELAQSLRDSYDNWKGKKFGLIRLSTTEMVVRYALDGKGLDLYNDVTFVEIADYANIIEGVRKGEVEIGSVDAMYAQQAKDLGLEIVFPLATLLPDYVCCRIQVSGQAYEEKRPALVAFLKGVIRAYKDYTEDPEGTAKILSDASKQTIEYTEGVVYDTDKNGLRIFNPEPNRDGVSAIYDTLLAWDYIERSGVTVDDIVDTTLFKEALDAVLAQYPNEPSYQKLKADFEANNHVS